MHQFNQLKVLHEYRIPITGIFGQGKLSTGNNLIGGQAFGWIKILMLLNGVI